MNSPFIVALQVQVFVRHSEAELASFALHLLWNALPDTAKTAKLNTHDVKDEIFRRSLCRSTKPHECPLKQKQLQYCSYPLWSTSEFTSASEEQNDVYPQFSTISDFKIPAGVGWGGVGRRSAEFMVQLKVYFKMLPVTYVRTQRA